MKPNTPIHAIRMSIRAANAIWFFNDWRLKWAKESRHIETRDDLAFNISHQYFQPLKHRNCGLKTYRELLKVSGLLTPKQLNTTRVRQMTICPKCRHTFSPRRHPQNVEHKMKSIF